MERQGAGVLDVGRAVAMALQETHTTLPESPHIGPKGVAFFLHDHHAQYVHVLGDWDGWQAPGLVAQQIEAGIWQSQQQRLTPGLYTYKFLLNETTWLADPANP